MRHQGIGIGKERIDEGIRYLSEVPVEDLLAHDDQYFPAPLRHVFTESWIRQPGGIAIGALNEGELVGYGVLRGIICHIHLAPLPQPYVRNAGGNFRSLPAGEKVQKGWLKLFKENISLPGRYPIQRQIPAGYIISAF